MKHILECDAKKLIFFNDLLGSSTVIIATGHGFLYLSRIHKLPHNLKMIKLVNARYAIYNE